MTETQSERPYSTGGEPPEHEHPYLPQRIAEDVIPYKGPDKLTQRLRVRREIVGLAVFLLIGIVAVVVVLMQGPIR